MSSAAVRSPSSPGARACSPASSLAGLLFPVAGGFGLLSNRASDVVANGSAELVEGDVPAVSTMVDAKGNTIAWLYDAAPLRGAQRPDRQHDEAGDRLDRGQALRRAQRRRLAGHAAGLSSATPQRSTSTPGRVDDRAAVRQELPAAGDRADRRRTRAAIETTPARKLREIRMALTLDKTLTKAEILTRYLNLVSFGNGVVRHPGRRADLLRRRRHRPELAAGRAAGRHGAVDQRAQPVHQPRRRDRAAKPGAGHHDREHPRAGRRAARRQGRAAGHPAAAERVCPAAASRPATAPSSATTCWSTSPRRHQQGAGRQGRLPDQHHARPGRAGLGQGRASTSSPPRPSTASPA